jgi:hypothetical protein
MQDKPEVT